jgi:hypothetical protein
MKLQNFEISSSIEPQSGAPWHSVAAMVAQKPPNRPMCTERKSTASTGQVNLAAARELDFWGQFRRATEAARANLVASEWARQALD